MISETRKQISDIIVVDDGSGDSTSRLAEEAGAYVLRHKTNMGKGMALRTGFAHALEKGFDAVLTLDADGQHDPSEIKKFFREFINNSGDIIIGTRLRDKAAVPLYRYIPNRIGVFFISWAAGCRIDDTQSGFRLYRKEVLESISLHTKGFETETEVLIKAGKMGFRIRNIPVSAIYHSDYKTNFRPVRDFYRISILFLKLTFLRGAR
ncbi:MAG: glycosyltransferase family 2 protein [Nitrospirota bacterium]